jgi:hypothetical protein
VTNSRDKGKRGELLFRDYLRARGYTEAKRGQQRAGGTDSPDVIGGPAGWHPEVKWVNALLTVKGRDAIAQATRDAAGKRWYIAHKWDGSAWYAIVPMDELFNLIQFQELV